MNCREAAYKAYLKALREEEYISDVLNNWHIESNPSQVDYHLAQEISYGTCQRALTLEFYAQKLVNKKLKLKRKEKALLFTALYQYFFLERIPLYAITNETMQIAKKTCHTTFVKFLNAILRKLSETKIELPKDHSIHSLSIRYSYPEFFIKTLIDDYGLEPTLNILEAGNIPSPTMARRRNLPLSSTAVDMVMIETKEELEKAQKDPNLYIQNITPARLFQEATKEIPPPNSILDLCSSPGGKLILSHDRFPNAQLYANDVSENKLKTIRENLDKYQITANLTCGLGQDYHSEQPFELIILDIPCSNSGVLNKRPEARWRQTKQHLKDLEALQTALLEHALTLLSPGGYILYMTCSILKSENEELVQKFTKQYNLKIPFSMTILPDKKGADGGFAAIITN